MGVPVTKHPLERAEKWSVDSYPVEREVGGPVLLVTVHGEFEESEFWRPDASFSFLRFVRARAPTFLRLTPLSPSSSRASPSPVPVMGLRSFDRSFILSPSPPDSAFVLPFLCLSLSLPSLLLFSSLVLVPLANFGPFFSSPKHRARAAGWPCVILSDQLTVRNYTASTAWEPDSLPLEPNVVIVPVIAVPQLVSII